jgi:hypothetical protein
MKILDVAYLIIWLKKNFNKSIQKTTYMRHGAINSSFCSTNECAMSRNFIVMIHGHPFPSNISSLILGSSFSSHTLHIVDVKSCKYCVQNPKASSNA